MIVEQGICIDQDVVVVEIILVMMMVLLRFQLAGVGRVVVEVLEVEAGMGVVRLRDILHRAVAAKALSGVF